MIVEHKSTPDPRTHFQIIHYLIGLWIRELKEGREPCPTLPLLVYHGVVPWRLPSRLSDLLRPPAELLDVTPDFVLPLLDLRRIEDEEIRRRVDDVEVVLALLSLKHIFDGLETLLVILKPEMNYMAGVYGITDSQEMKRIVDPIVREVGMAQDIVDTWMEEYLQMGLQQGLQQGVQLGIRQGVE